MTADATKYLSHLELGERDETFDAEFLEII